MILCAFCNIQDRHHQFLNFKSLFNQSDTFLLTNLTLNLPGTNILLWRRGSSVVTASNLMITRDPRFRLLDEYSLQIKGVRPQDAGDYICQSELNFLFHVPTLKQPKTNSK
jgi:hypothetical protein